MQSSPPFLPEGRRAWPNRARSWVAPPKARQRRPRRELGEAQHGPEEKTPCAPLQWRHARAP
eukprot:3019548-Alexandrium_andersonii.AAC.1